MEFSTYHKIRQLGNQENEDIFLDKEDEIFITAKYDGANMRFIFKDEKIIFGSRTQQLTSDTGEDTNMSKNFIRCANHIRENILKLPPEHLKSMEHLIFYGECMVKHSLSYDWDKIPPFLGFDIYDTKDKVFLNYIIITKIFKELGLEIVPLVWNGKVIDLPKFLDKHGK